VEERIGSQRAVERLDEPVECLANSCEEGSPATKVNFAVIELIEHVNVLPIIDPYKTFQQAQLLRFVNCFPFSLHLLLFFFLPAVILVQRDTINGGVLLNGKLFLQIQEGRDLILLF